MSRHDAHDHPQTPNRPSVGDEHLRALLRAAKLRITTVRLGVLAVLNSSDHALNAQQVFDAVAARHPRSAALDRVTVYRTLNTLVDSGLAHKLDPGDRVFRFRLTDHSRCSHPAHELPAHHDHASHPHFVCDSCGTVECLESAQVQLSSIPAPNSSKSPASPASPAPRRILKQDVVLHGTCPDCTPQDPPQSPPRSAKPR